MTHLFFPLDSSQALESSQEGGCGVQEIGISVRERNLRLVAAPLLFPEMGHSPLPQIPTGIRISNGIRILMEIPPNRHDMAPSRFANTFVDAADFPRAIPDSTQGQPILQKYGYTKN